MRRLSINSYALKSSNLIILEETLVQSAKKKSAQFNLGRKAATTSLAELGWNKRFEIPQGQAGEPIWPKGYTGSISHTVDSINKKIIAVALTAKTEEYRSIGIDIECLSRQTTTKIRRKLGNQREWRALQSESQVELMLFSAKEALFKLLYPLTKTMFYFHDAELIWKPEMKSFLAILKKDLNQEFVGGYGISVRVIRQENYLLSYSVL